MRCVRAIYLGLFSCLLFLPIVGIQADTIDELREKIVERNRAIKELEKEIVGYQNELEVVGKEAKTLQSTIRSIDLEQKKLATEIRVTETKIGAVGLAIEELTGDIGDKEKRISGNREAIGETIRSINEIERESLFETILSGKTLSAFWEQVDALERFQGSVKTDLRETETLKTLLEKDKEQNEQNRRELVSLKGELSDRKFILEQNRKSKNTLLSATKSKETEYKKLISKKMAARNAFEQELLEFESALRLEVDQTRIPSSGSGILKWPIDLVKVTQYFGNTDFARAGGYNGKGHNGIDLRATTGTRIKAALGGKVLGIGNTDTVCPGASYGKWVLIEHGNGLSTLYAHLSLIKVSENQMVGTGDTIGYSGETGYATGPHLHFTVYATQGVRIMERKSAVCKGTYIMPIADLKAYLNPMQYL